jgi:sRNA-binding carbon storage regulator CsrA
VSSLFGLFCKSDGGGFTPNRNDDPRAGCRIGIPGALPDDLRHLIPRYAPGETAALPGKVAGVPVVLQTLTDTKKEVAAMLLFTRREGESLVLETSDGLIELKLAYLNGEHARIGVDAPSSVSIVRKEASHRKDLKETPAELDLENELWWRHPEDMTA